jgi:hypothetical protein
MRCGGMDYFFVEEARISGNNDNAQHRATAWGAGMSMYRLRSTRGHQKFG